jgi:succinate dehydrogenase/fumarate reductase flavoprotein subunit
MASVDVIVIGTGSAAQTVAYTCREAGATTSDHRSAPGTRMPVTTASIR